MKSQEIQRPMWMAQVKNNALDVYVYDDVKPDEYDWWSGETIESETSANYFRNLLDQNADVQNINIYINSCGGSVMEGLAIYNQLARHKAYKTAYIDGFACSIASVIPMAADKIVMPKASMLMIHNAWTIAAGNASELRKIANDLDEMSQTIAQAYLQKSNGKIDAETLKALMDGESYLSSDKCLEYGLCDEVVEKSNEDEKAKLAVEDSRRQQMQAVLNKTVTAGKAAAMAHLPEEEPQPEPDPEPAPEPEKEEQKPEAHVATAAENFMKYFTKGE